MRGPLDSLNAARRSWRMVDVPPDSRSSVAAVGSWPLAPAYKSRTAAEARDCHSASSCRTRSSLVSWRGQHVGGGKDRLGCQQLQ